MKKVYILLLIVILLGGSVLAFALTRPNTPEEAPDAVEGDVLRQETPITFPDEEGPVEVENEGPRQETSITFPEVEWVLSLGNLDEVNHLRTLLDGDDESLEAFLQGTGEWVNHFITRAEVEQFFTVMDDIYFPVNKYDWFVLIYDHGREVTLMYIDGGDVIYDGDFMYSIRISLDEGFSRDLIEHRSEEGMDVTDEISALIRQEATNELSFRIGEGIRVYQTREFSAENPGATFGLDMQGIHVSANMSDAPSEEVILDILANLEFVRGAFVRP